MAYSALGGFRFEYFHNHSIYLHLCPGSQCDQKVAKIGGVTVGWYFWSSFFWTSQWFQDNETFGKAKPIILALSKFRLSRLCVMLFSCTLLTSNNMISLFTKSHFGSRYERDHSTKKWNLLTNQKLKGPSSDMKIEENVSAKCRLSQGWYQAPSLLHNNSKWYLCETKKLAFYWNHTQQY